MKSPQRLTSAVHQALLISTAILPVEAGLQYHLDRIKVPEASSIADLGSATPVTVPTSMTSGRFEIAPAGTYGRLEEALAMYRQIVHGASSTTISSTTGFWRDQAIVSVDNAIKDADAEGAPIPSIMTSVHAKELLLLCSGFPLSEPVLAHDDKGGLEIYFKENNRALLMSLPGDGYLTVFGDDGEERWRLRAQMPGRFWRRQIPELLDELIRT